MTYELEFFGQGIKKLTLADEGAGRCMMMDDSRFKTVAKKHAFDSLTTRDINGLRKHEVLVPDHFAQDLKAQVRKKDPNVPENGDNL